MSLYTNKDDIKVWLDKYEISKYQIKKDKTYGYIVDVDYDVFLFDKNLDNIPVKFGVVTGSFDCSRNNLTSLEFAPDNCRDFYCHVNNLSSLKGSPRVVERDFFCSDNPLISLEYCPDKIEGVFQCSNNKIKSLEFCPSYVGKDFYALSDIYSLEFIPEYVGRKFMVTYLGENNTPKVIDDYKELLRESIVFKKTNSNYLKKSLAQELESSLENKATIRKIKV